MTTFGITKRTVEYLQQRLIAGESIITDGRGLDPNPRRTPPGIPALMDRHIDSFMKFETHYSRRRTGQFYLHPDLSFSRMFAMFLAQNPNDPSLPHKINEYRAAFRRSGLSIGQPKTDTCKNCDTLHVNLAAAMNENERNTIEGQIHQHHLTTDDAYVALNQNIARSKIDPNFIVKCGDLQQVE
jgi:hypothetical protein